MADALWQQRSDFQIHYLAHSRETAPFLAELEASPFKYKMETYLGSGAQARRFDAMVVLALEPGAHFYVCGPARLLDGVKEAASALNFDTGRLHQECFTADVDRKGEAFFVQTSRTGLTMEVPQDRSIAQALAERGVVIKISCEQGV